jgi:formylglycine-generating enzyme required for sulfatase activity
MIVLARKAAVAVVCAVGLVRAAEAQQCCTGNVSTYCTAGTSVQGCVPQISGVGVPSMNATSGFDIAIPNMPGQRFGSIFYGFYSLVTPWAPGSPSFRCVANPVQRTGNLFSGGTPGQCDGELRLDFNAWRAANPGALGSPFAVGQTIRAQGWYRDPAAPSQTNLSDALVFNLCSGGGDTVPPAITTCAQSLSTCPGVVPDVTASVVASDNCNFVTLTQSPAAGTSVSVGTTLITITATDPAGNSSSCVATLTVTPCSCQTPPGFVAIQPGSFQMGSSAPSGPPYFNEYGNADPAHQVTLSYCFWMGAREVTQSHYSALMGANPSNFGGGTRPVERVSWLDAQAYCAVLTAQQAALGKVPPGYQYRLPTEAEWEYACRAGTNTEFNVGASLFCNQGNVQFSHHSNSPCGTSSTVAVGGYAPNGWGLYDMHGNVYEWCLDSLSGYSGGAVTDPFVTGGPYRVLRGGSWATWSDECRSASREASDPGFVYSSIGFRVVLAPILVP